MLKIRRPLGRLIFNMGIAIPGKTVFLIETAPRSQDISSHGIKLVIHECSGFSNTNANISQVDLCDVSTGYLECYLTDTGISYACPGASEGILRSISTIGSKHIQPILNYSKAISECRVDCERQ